MEYTNTYIKAKTSDIVFDGTYKTIEEAEKAYQKFANKVKGCTLDRNKTSRVFNWMGEERKYTVVRYYIGGENRNIRYIYTIEEIPNSH